MPPQRQDYILRLIAELREFVSAMLHRGGPGRAEEALHAILHAQQQLFQRPPAEFLRLTLAEQIDLLAKGESPAGAAEKVATYAEILIEAARVYDGLDRSGMAAGSRQLALGVLLSGALRWPGERAAFDVPIATLRRQLTLEALNPPVQEMLSAYDALA